MTILAFRSSQIFLGYRFFKDEDQWESVCDSVKMCAGSILLQACSEVRLMQYCSNILVCAKNITNAIILVYMYSRWVSLVNAHVLKVFRNMYPSHYSTVVHCCFQNRMQSLQRSLMDLCLWSSGTTSSISVLFN